jgi:hypothetical protein
MNSTFLQKAPRIVGIALLVLVMLFLAFLLIGDALHRLWVATLADMVFLGVGYQWLRETLQPDSPPQTQQSCQVTDESWYATALAGAATVPVAENASASEPRRPGPGLADADVPP